MELDWAGLVSAVMFGVGLAVDAFLIALSNGINSHSKNSKAVFAAVVFAVFQFAAPMIGHLLVHTLVTEFTVLEKILSGIAIVILCGLGLKMITDGMRGDNDRSAKPMAAGIALILAQAAAASVDALSIGFAIADREFITAVIYSAIIAAVTLVAYICGIYIGKRFGLKLTDVALTAGGLILYIMGAASVFM